MQNSQTIGKIRGRCLCGTVTFETANTFRSLILCSCDQCRQITGSAFASNLVADGEGFAWLSGADFIVHYRVPRRDISKAFCRVCGSGVPWIGGDGTGMFVPAGCLDGQPNVVERLKIFAAEQPSWARGLEQVRAHPGFPG